MNFIHKYSNFFFFFFSIAGVFHCGCLYSSQIWINNNSKWNGSFSVVLTGWKVSLCVCFLQSVTMPLKRECQSDMLGNSLLLVGCFYNSYIRDTWKKCWDYLFSDNLFNGYNLRKLSLGWQEDILCECSRRGGDWVSLADDGLPGNTVNSPSSLLS